MLSADEARTVIRLRDPLSMVIHVDMSSHKQVRMLTNVIIDLRCDNIFMRSEDHRDAHLYAAC